MNTNPEPKQSAPFRHEGSKVICRLETGREIVVAEAVDKHWAEAIAYGLNLDYPISEKS
jgi:hypothetical protein